MKTYLSFSAVPILNCPSFLKLSCPWKPYEKQQKNSLTHVWVCFKASLAEFGISPIKMESPVLSVTVSAEKSFAPSTPSSLLKKI